MEGRCFTYQAPLLWNQFWVLVCEADTLFETLGMELPHQSIMWSGDHHHTPEMARHRPQPTTCQNLTANLAKGPATKTRSSNPKNLNDPRRTRTPAPLSTALIRPELWRLHLWSDSSSRRLQILPKLDRYDLCWSYSVRDMSTKDVCYDQHQALNRNNWLCCLFQQL